MLNLEFSNQSKKFLKKCDKNLRKRILDKIKLLRNNPVPHKSVSIVDEDNTFRIRIGDYRATYEIKWDKKEILIAKVDKRPRAYKK
tara:strand:- start:1068 stop:1325 length:258 start_codon:yes stop_codon:yes gene_type:complete